MKQYVVVVLIGFTTSAIAAEEPKREKKDEAVEMALRQLQRVQERDGSWAGGEKNPAVTSLVVLAFLSAGYGPEDKGVGETVEKGIRHVLKAQQADGLI